jgi:hypothetical protein
MFMKGAWGQVFVGLSLLGCGAGAFSACVHDDSTIYVHDALAPKFAQMGSICTWTPDPTQAFISSGVLDVSLQSQYEGIFLVANQMVPEVNPNQLQTETSIVTIQGAIVRVTDRNGINVRPNFTRLTAATIPPSSGGVPGFAPVSVTIVDRMAIEGTPDIAQLQLGFGGAVRLVTYVRFYGKTTGGQSVESNEFEFPVDVCNGCLVNFTNDPSAQTPNCIPTAGSSTSTGTPQLPCTLGQDLRVDCTVVCQDIPECAANTPMLGADAGAG